MKEYERLTKCSTLSRDKSHFFVVCNYEDQDCNDSCLYGGYKCKWVEKALLRLAELEDKIEYGKLVELPGVFVNIEAFKSCPDMESVKELIKYLEGSQNEP